MKAMFAAAVLGLFATACGAGGSSTGTGETCSEKHECVNGSCTCSSGPKSGSSCCDPNSATCSTDKCDTFCRFCQ